MAHSRISGMSHPDGIAMDNAKPGESLRVMTRALITSDDPLFHRFIENVTPAYFTHHDVLVFPDAVSQFLFVLHADGAGDLYFNDFATVVEMMAKRTVPAGTIISDDDFADVRRVRFPGIAIGSNDKIVYCFKAGWKFGLFFDLGSPRTSSLDEIELACGTLRRYLMFQHVYDGLSGLDAGYMRMDGWFPFVEILGRDFRTLRDAYAPGGDVIGLTERVVSGFTSARLERMITRWWGTPVFKEKQDLLTAGVHAFMTVTPQGDIQCIKTLYSEIEGLIRSVYLQDTGKGNHIKIDDVIEHIVERGRAKSGSDQSLLLPKEFLTYLKEVLFAKFNVERGDVDLSRHSSSHGVARGSDYTRARALQAILAVDQLHFYL